ncbi:MAG: T9SS type A sorting domain-containing protein [candidate division WOR-3 bacterium]|nr:MAG: T9SS type A sorting domain-containing protein [candidate division WOR-3 bacterium]
MPRRISFILLIIIGLGLAAENETTRLVDIKIEHHDQVYSLNRYRLTITDAGTDYVRALVNDHEIATLESAGYRVTIVIEDYQAYKDDVFKRGFYRTYAEVYAALDSFVTDYGNICRLDTIGLSVQGRAIWAMRVTNNLQIEEDEPEIRLAGNIHGDEHIGTEITLYFLRYLLTNYATNAQVQALIDSNEIWILPTLNPDGKVANTRRNANNVDLNRDYGYFWDAWGGSPAPSSQIENQLLMQHLEENNVSLEYNYHSAAQYVNYPWDYHQADPPDSLYIILLSEIYADSASLVAINGYDWYQITGSLQDYTIGTNGAFAWTIETLEPSASSAIDQICYNNRDALMDICSRTRWGITGVVKDSISDSLLYARVEFIEPERIDIYTDPYRGDFHKMIEPGTYSLRITANGYTPKTMNDVSIAPQSGVSVGDILLVPDSTYHHAFKVVITRYADHDEQGNKTQPRHALGPADSLWFSLGRSGYIVLDMGANSPITDGPGDDFTLFEGDDGIDEGYGVYVSTDWFGSWVLCGTDTGTASFDLSTAGLSEARYVKIVDDGDMQLTQYSGFDLDAIHAGPPVGITNDRVIQTTDPFPYLSVLPNPFTELTIVSFSTGHRAERTELMIYDAAGRMVTDLSSTITHAPSTMQVVWDGRDGEGRRVPSGVYFVRLDADRYSSIEKVILLR